MNRHHAQLGVPNNFIHTSFNGKYIDKYIPLAAMHATLFHSLLLPRRSRRQLTLTASKTPPHRASWHRIYSYMLTGASSHCCAVARRIPYRATALGDVNRRKRKRLHADIPGASSRRATIAQFVFKMNALCICKPAPRRSYFNRQHTFPARRQRENECIALV